MLSETEMAEMVTVNVAKILKAQGAPDGQAKWGTKEHNTLLMLTAKDCGMDADCAKEFVAFLPIAGIGGNSAQFRQSKFLKGKIPQTTTMEQKLSIYDL